MVTQEFVIDGARCTSLDAFMDEVSRVFVPGVEWDHSLDGFRDILEGAFGPIDPDADVGSVSIVWTNARIPQASLGYPTTIAFYEEMWQMMSQGLSEDDLWQRHTDLLKDVYPDWDEATVQEHLSNFQVVCRAIQANLARARQHEGDTLFDWLVRTIRIYSHITFRLEL